MPSINPSERPSSIAEHGRDRAPSALLGEHLLQLLARAAAQWPGKTALIDGERHFTFAELAETSARLAGGLRSLEIGPGDVVAAQLPNRWEFVALQLAIARLGGVLATIHMPYRSREVQTIVALSGARTLVCMGSGEHLETALGLRKNGALQHVVTVGGDHAKTLAFDSLVAHALAEPTEIHPSDPFVLAFTSGTEAQPRGCLHRHDAYVSNTYWCAAEYPLAESDVILCTSPFTHMFGNSSILIALHRGSTQVLLAAFDPTRFLALAREHGVTFAMAVPPQILALAQAVRDGAERPASLQRFITGGMRVPEAVVRLAREWLGCEVQTQWGMTEVAAGTFTRSGEAPERAWNSVGRPIRGAEVRVVDDDGRPLPPGSEGELAYRSPFMVGEYLDDAAATGRAFTSDGWLLTGDLATIDQDGYVAIMGRTKDLVNRGGLKLHPGEIEDLLLEHSAVRQAAVVAMPDERLGERSCAYVVLAQGESLSLPGVAQFLLERGIAKFKLPERLEVRAELPTTPTRKVQKSLLRAEIAELAQRTLTGWKLVGADLTDLTDQRLRWEIGLSVEVSDPAGAEIVLDRAGAVAALASARSPAQLLRVEARGTDVVQHDGATAHVRVARVVGEEPSVAF